MFRSNTKDFTFKERKNVNVNFSSLVWMMNKSLILSNNLQKGKKEERKVQANNLCSIVMDDEQDSLTFIVADSI